MRAVGGIGQQLRRIGEVATMKRSEWFTTQAGHIGNQAAAAIGLAISDDYRRQQSDDAESMAGYAYDISRLAAHLALQSVNSAAFGE
jgi:hypothetical protein